MRLRSISKSRKTKSLDVTTQTKTKRKRSISTKNSLKSYNNSNNNNANPKAKSTKISKIDKLNLEQTPKNYEKNHKTKEKTPKNKEKTPKKDKKSTQKTKNPSQNHDLSPRKTRKTRKNSKGLITCKNEYPLEHEQIRIGKRKRRSKSHEDAFLNNNTGLKNIMGIIGNNNSIGLDGMTGINEQFIVKKLKIEMNEVDMKVDETNTQKEFIQGNEKKINQRKSLTKDNEHDLTKLDILKKYERKSDDPTNNNTLQIPLKRNNEHDNLTTTNTKTSSVLSKSPKSIIPNNITTTTNNKNTSININNNSKLPQKLQDLISLIYNTTIMDKQISSLGYDIHKTSLSTLSLGNIQKAYGVLKELTNAIIIKKTDKISMLSNEFYGLIPHNPNYQNANTSNLQTLQMIREKLDLLESLSNIYIAHKLLEENPEDECSIDSNYKKLNCKIEIVDKKSNDYKIITDYINNTKESNKFEILDIFKINRDGEDKRFTKNLHNHMMLWNGQRLANLAGILSQGLKIPPPEAPLLGYEFGKGIYLSDMISKSLQYCCYSPSSKDPFCVLLCEAALGTPNELIKNDSNGTKLPKGKHSTKALGHIAPREKLYEEFENGILIPTGKPSKTHYQHTPWEYNEFVVYDAAQVKLRYLVRIKTA